MKGLSMDPMQIVEQFGIAWSSHDLDATLAMITDDCVFDTTEPAPDGTKYVGKAAVREAWRPIFEDLAANFEAEDTFGAGDRVVQLWTYTWATGHVRGVDIFRVRDELVCEKFSYVKG